MSRYDDKKYITRVPNPIGDSCEWCGKHIPAGTNKYIDDEGTVYCSRKCSKEED